MVDKISSYLLCFGAAKISNKTKTAKLNSKQYKLLITEVQKRPLLYDLKNPGYKNTQLKAKEWAIVGAAVGEITG